MRPPTDVELVWHALEVARHELATLHGLIAFDGAAPSETFAIDTSAAREAVDEALALWVGRGVVEPKPPPAIVPDHKGWPPPPPPPRAPNVDPGTHLPSPRVGQGGCLSVAALALAYVLAVLS